MMASFPVDLPSGSSATYYPDNKIGDYTTRLREEINLTGKWEVAVKRIDLPITWYNIQSDNNMFQVFHRSFKWQKLYIEKGRYNTNEDFVTEVERVIQEFLLRAKSNNPGGPVKWPKNIFAYNTHSLKVKINLGKLEGMKLKFSPNFAGMLGFEARKTVIDGHAGVAIPPYVVDVHHGRYKLYIYTDIIENRMIGDTIAPVLAKVVIDPRSRSPVYEHWFKEPVYVPLRTHRFQTIRIHIRDDTGNIVPFQSGKSEVDLLFRQSKPNFL